MNDFIINKLLVGGHQHLDLTFRHWFANRFERKLLYKIITPLISIIVAPLILIEKLIWGFSSQWSWSLPAYFNGLKVIKNNKIDLIYSTGGAWSAHLAAYWLKRKTKISWIAEIHDPLVQRENKLDFELKHQDNQMKKKNIGSKKKFV